MRAVYREAVWVPAAMRIVQSFVVDGEHRYPIVEVKDWDTRSVKYGRSRAQGHVIFRRNEQFWHGRFNGEGHVTTTAPFTDARRIRELNKKWLSSASVSVKVVTLNTDTQGESR